MITKNDIQKIIDDREKKFDEWLKKNPKKLSILKLKQYLSQKWSDVGETKKVSKENDPKWPKNEFGFVYTLMNILPIEYIR